MTALARLSLMLAALVCWCGGSRRVALALLVVVVASTVSTLLPREAGLVVYLVAPAASACLALHVAFGAEPVASALGFVAVLWVGAVLPPSTDAAWWASIACQLVAVAALARPLDREALCVVALLAGDVAAALLSTLGAPYWLTQGQAVLVSGALAWIHRDVFPCTAR